MKDYKQMTADVLQRAQVNTYKRNRIRRRIAYAGGLCCLALLAAVNILTYMDREKGVPPIFEQPPAQIGSQPTEGIKEPDCNFPFVTIPSEDMPQSSGVVLLVASSSNDVGTELMENLTLPLNYFLRVRDLRGLTNAERENAIDDERAFLNGQMNIITPGTGVKRGNCAIRKNCVITFVRTGWFRLQIENYDNVESIRIKSNSRYGMLDVELSEFPYPRGQEIELVPEDIPELDRRKGLCINWNYTSALLQALDENPEMPLSSFSDTITFSVKFLDGTVQENKVRLEIQDDGQFVVSLLLDSRSV
jgi:hypothetical protein